MFGTDDGVLMFPNDYPRYDYAEQEAEDQRRENVWLNRFPWLTEAERMIHRLADHPAFPGAYAEEADYDAFAVQLRRDSQRQVSCVFLLSWGTVRGAFDLVTGAADLVDNGSYSRATELPESVDILFDEDEPRAVLRAVHLNDGFANVGPVDTDRMKDKITFAEILSREARPISTAALGRIVEHLARVGKLPPVTASVNGRRFGTYHPL